MGDDPQENVHALAWELEGQLRQPGDDADELARQILDTMPDVVADERVIKLLVDLAKRKPLVAASLLLHIARAAQTVRDTTTRRSSWAS